MSIVCETIKKALKGSDYRAQGHFGPPHFHVSEVFVEVFVQRSEKPEVTLFFGV